MFSKTYNVNIHRKISEPVLIKEEVKNSDFYLHVEEENKSFINSSFETEIYSIERNTDSLVIYSNTTNIKVTDKFYNDVPLYYVYDTSIGTLELSDIPIKIQEDSYLFLNKDGIKDPLKELKLIYEIGNPLTRSENIKIRKLKDRLKITIKNIDGVKAKIELNSKYLFEPKIHRNYLEFPESIVKLANNVVYLYNSSFNPQVKKEITSKNDPLLKDPVQNIIEIQDYDSESYLITYDTYKTNLMFNSKINSNLYVYLNLNSSNKTDMLEISTKEVESSSYILLYVKYTTKQKQDIGFNPYNETTVETPLGENYSIVFEENSSEKYHQSNDIKIATEVLNTNVFKLLDNRVRYLNVNGQQLYQTTEINNYYYDYKTKYLNDVEEVFKDNLYLFLQQYGNSREEEAT